MTAVTRLMDNARIRLPGALDGLIQLELFNTLDEFCRTTSAYREQLETTLIVAQSVYTIEPADKEIVLIYKVAHTTLSLIGAIYDDGDIALPVAPAAADIGFPLITDVSLTPRIGGAEDPELWMPESVYEKHFNTILDGLLWRMMSQIAKPYSSERMALYHSKRFRNGMARARAKVFESAAPDTQAWSFPRFTR